MPTLVRQHRNRNNRLSPYRVFQIPELLCQIFAFLDNTTLRKTIILVCRQWYWMNKDRIVREVLFDSGLTLDDLKRRMVQRIPRATHLYCFFRRSGSDHDDEKVAWLLGLLEQVHKEEENRKREHQHKELPPTPPSTNRISNRNGSKSKSKSRFLTTGIASVLDATQDEIKKRPLLHLTLQGYVEIGMGVSGFLPYMATLTRLTINQVCDSNFTMSELFETCTQLEHLYIQSLWTVHLTGPWIPDNSTIDDSPPPQLLPLKSLKLIHVQFPQSCLEILLTSTPHLKELKLVLRGYIADDENDLTHLCQHLQSLPELKLESFHFSIGSDTHPQTYDDYARMMALCPKSTGWTIRGPHLSLDTSRLITESSSNRITALEVLGYTAFLHDLLCYLPHLLSVKAATCDISCIELNIFAKRYRPVRTLRPSSDESVYENRVWACRGLQTCHLSLSDVGRKWFGYKPSRVVYGYISRVCPNIRDLKLSFPMVFMENASWEDSSLKAMSCLNIASGFCQLARLKHLESLCIDEVDLDGLLFESHDIDWMVSSASSSPLSLPLLSSSVSGLSGSGGSGDLSSSVTSRQLSPWSQRRWSKQKRRRAISLCAEYYCDEKSKFTENVKLINSMSDSEILEKYGADRVLMLQLCSCGLRMDVKQVIGEIDGWWEQKKRGRLWPRLEQLAIYRTCGFRQSPEVEVARLIALGMRNRQKDEPEAPASNEGGVWSWKKLVGR